MLARERNLPTSARKRKPKKAYVGETADNQKLISALIQSALAEYDTSYFYSPEFNNHAYVGEVDPEQMIQFLEKKYHLSPTRLCRMAHPHTPGSIANRQDLQPLEDIIKFMSRDHFRAVASAESRMPDWVRQLWYERLLCNVTDLLHLPEIEFIPQTQFFRLTIPQKEALVKEKGTVYVLARYSKKLFDNISKRARTANFKDLLAGLPLDHEVFTSKVQKTMRERFKTFQEFLDDEGAYLTAELPDLQVSYQHKVNKYRHYYKQLGATGAKYRRQANES